MDPTDEIRAILESNRFAVLATQSRGQPHTSLVAFTPIDGIRGVVFATYRSTRKFRSLLVSRRVALFISDGMTRGAGPAGSCLLTAHGVASEARSKELGLWAREHTKRHPDLGPILSAPDAALVHVEVTAYQLVSGFDDVRWVQARSAA